MLLIILANCSFMIVSGTIPAPAGLNAGSLVIAVAGYLIVFAALVLLFGFFSLVPRILNIRVGRKRPGGTGGAKRSDRVEISGEETAAIALALYLFTEESHDRESGVLTIKRISRAYSPWSSKIYAVRNQFNRH
jgi:glutaconyl-CoA/methylmalonyl-CoA decarboxylase subunit delta